MINGLVPPEQLKKASVRHLDLCCLLAARLTCFQSEAEALAAYINSGRPKDQQSGVPKECHQSTCSPQPNSEAEVGLGEAGPDDLRDVRSDKGSPRGQHETASFGSSFLLQLLLCPAQFTTLSEVGVTRTGSWC